MLLLGLIISGIGIIPTLQIGQPLLPYTREPSLLYTGGTPTSYTGGTTSYTGITTSCTGVILLPYTGLIPSSQTWVGSPVSAEVEAPAEMHVMAMR